MIEPAHRRASLKLPELMERTASFRSLRLHSECCKLMSYIVGHMPTPEMPRDSVTFRLDAAKRAELDAVAKAMDRDRSYVLSEAVDAYLDVHRWQVAHIHEGLRQADAGEFASDEEVAAAFDRWKA